MYKILGLYCTGSERGRWRRLYTIFASSEAVRRVPFDKRELEAGEK